MSGYLKAGQWHEGWYDTGKTAGEFVRTTSRFRSWITADGSSGYRCRTRALPPVRVARLPLGAPHTHRACAERAAGRDLGIRGRACHDAGLEL